jgi:hypothetical protein
VLWREVFQPFYRERLDLEALCRAHLDLLLHGLLLRSEPS